MYLFYVTAEEATKSRKPAVADLHAVIAIDHEHLKERCTKLFTKFYYPVSWHKLNKDW